MFSALRKMSKDPELGLISAPRPKKVKTLIFITPRILSEALLD